MPISLSAPDITEKEVQAVCKVLRSGRLSLGPKLVEFEETFARHIGRKRAVAVSSGTAGLFLCLKALDIGPGDEVITTPFTFISTATSVMMVGARPVFVDIDADSLNIDPARIESAVTDRTKAVLPVEVFGNPSGFDRISRIAEERGLTLIEDSCEALGSALGGRKTGTFGKASLFAFYPNKQITTGEGGIILTDDDRMADLCVSLRNQGRDPGSNWLVHARLGYNFRLSDIHCALGIVQLSRLDEIKAKRAQVASWYQEMLAGDDRLIVPSEPPGCEISWFVFVVRLSQDFTAEQRDQILRSMRERDIQVSNYFPPVHLQPFMVERFGYQRGDLPITESVCDRTIALPFHSKLKQDQVAQVCGALKNAMESDRR